VTFTGALPHTEIPQHLAALDIAVAPYRFSDDFYFSPLKVMEYMAMGRAIVAPMLGQIPSLLQGADGPCGLLYPADDQQELATVLLRLIGDTGLRQILGTRAAKQASQHYSWQAVAQHVIARILSMEPNAQKNHLLQVVRI
jgi:glycosyltransferase involved in cell wall biosynthesis